LCYNAPDLASSADGKLLPGRRRTRAKTWALVLIVTALAAALRTLALAEVPPGLYHDEAFNGLDALKVIAGHRPPYFAANHGREPLFIYLIAATVGVLGRTPGALRLAAALCGTLTIPAAYLMARAWFNRRVSVLSAATLAITLWHVHLSRIGFRAITLPLTTALALWLGTRAYRSRRRRDWLLAGLLYGLCFYSYLPARFSPVALAVFALYLLSTGRASRLWPGLAWFAIGALLILAPLIAYSLSHWSVVLGRTGQVSIFNPLVNGGDLWGALGRQLVETLGMFFIRGDVIPRHNVPGRPVFDPLLGAAMMWGLGRALLRARKEAASAITLIWIGLMLAPTWLAGGTPHFLRAVGVLPLLALLPALGIDAALAWLERRGRRRWATALACATLSIGLAATVRDYFFRYRCDPQTAYAFENAATELAAEANRFSGVGWDGRGLIAPTGAPQRGRWVYVESRLWEEWAAIPFLIPESESVSLLPTERTPDPTDTTLLLLWPYEGLGRYQHLLPSNARIEAQGGPLTRGDVEDTPYEAYVAYKATPRAVESGDLLANFGDRIALTGYAIQTGERGWRVRLEWEALAPIEKNYTVFVHLRDGDWIAAQDDGEPAEGHYPTSLWRKGDVVVDTHVLLPPEEWGKDHQLVVGLYLWPEMERLELAARPGESPKDEFVLPIRPSGQ